MEPTISRHAQARSRQRGYRERDIDRLSTIYRPDQARLRCFLSRRRGMGVEQ